jgi:hypothetical protein
VRVFVVLALAASVGCVRPKAATTPSEKVKLLTLPAESDVFPKLAVAVTEALAHAKVSGVSESATSQASIEAVQLLIECVDPTADCYDAAAKSLAANQLLFAHIDGSRGKPKVTVTLFDRATKLPKTSEHTYATEAAALDGLEGLVAEATR